MTKEEILSASPALLNNWIDACVMNDHEGYGKSDWTGDISAAWEVVEKIGSVKVLGPNIEREWYASVLGNRNFGVFAKSAPEAICKAALIAVMEGSDEES